MRVRLSWAAVAVAIAGSSYGFSRPHAVAVAAPTTTHHDQTTIDDQTDLSLTVYNSDLALVRDTRNVTLRSGSFDLRFMDIAATVNPATIHFRSLTNPGAVSVLEQNYEYDLLEPEKLLRKYVGRDVTLVRTVQKNGSSVQEEVRAHLLSYNNGPVWQIGNEIVTGLHADHIRFPELPGNLFSRPTLIWTLQNTGSTQQRVEASYLATKLAWNADYVLTVARDDKAGDLDGWVTLTNGSGTAFKNAKLQLVAGDLNRVQREIRQRMEMSARTDVAAAEEKMAQESFSDYHLYTLGRRTTIANSETKQVSMLSGTGVPMLKRYVVDGQAFYYHNARHPGAPIKDVVQVYYQFRNEEKAGLGMPMPSGVVRVYQADSKGGVQFVGEDRINHTPKDETLKLKIGNAFDVICERNQTDFRKISSTTHEVEYEITLRNHKATPVTVEVNEPIGGTWTMLRSSHEWTKTAAWASQFTVPVAAEDRCVEVSGAGDLLTRAKAPRYDCKLSSARRVTRTGSARLQPRGRRRLLLLDTAHRLRSRGVVLERLEDIAPRELLSLAAHVVVHPRHLADGFGELIARVRYAVRGSRIHEQFGRNAELFERHVQLDRLRARHTRVAFDDVNHGGGFGVLDVFER